MSDFEKYPNEPSVVKKQFQTSDGTAVEVERERFAILDKQQDSDMYS